MSEKDVISKLEDIMGTISNDACAKGQHGNVPDEAPHTGLMEYLYNTFGGFSVAMGAIKTATNCATKLFPESKKYQKISRFAEGAVPVIMTTIKVREAVKRYMDSRRRPKRRIDEEKIFFSHMLDIEDNYYLYRSKEYDLNGSSEEIGPVLEWFLTMPNTNSVSTLGVMDYKFDFVDDYSKVEKMSTSYIMYRLADTFDIAIKVERNTFGKKISGLTIMFNDKYKYHSVLMLCSYAYVESLDFRENLITFRAPNDITVSPRHNVNHSVYQMKEEMVTEIQKSMEKGKKRCYALIGSPGTGKTTIVNKIVDDIRDVPAICIPCSSGSESKDKIAWALMMSRMISPCIVILEDIDALPLEHKYSEYLDLFIECLDSAKYNHAVTYLVTLNEPEKVHESLMDRRGRFDRLIMVEAPKKRSEVDEVMGNVYKREIGTEMPDNILSEEFYEIAKETDLRQSDFAEIITRIGINDMPMTPSSFTAVLKDIRDSQKNVDYFKSRHKGSSGNDLKKAEEFPCTSTSPSSSGPYDDGNSKPIGHAEVHDKGYEEAVHGVGIENF